MTAHTSVEPRSPHGVFPLQKPPVRFPGGKEMLPGWGGCGGAGAGGAALSAKLLVLVQRVATCPCFMVKLSPCGAGKGSGGVEAESCPFPPL